MITSLAYWIVLGLGAVVFWLLPRQWRFGFLAALSFGYLATLAPLSVFALTAWAALFYVAAVSPGIRRFGGWTWIVIGLLGFLAWFADGFLYYHRRRDRLLKSMGVRVSPGEVEDLLYGSGLLREVAVFGRPHDLIGDEVWVAIVPADGAADALGRPRTYARGAMSQHMQPRRYLVRTAMPRTPPSGKIDYPALEREAARAPSASLTGAPAASR